MSGSDSNVEVKITANVDDLKAQLAQAQASVKAFSSTVDDLTAVSAKYGPASVATPLAAAKAAADDARQSVADLTAEIAKIEAPARAAAESVGTIAPAANEAAAATDKIAPAADRAAHGSSQVTREFIVLGHEAMQGRFSRIPGSLMVMAEYSGTLRTALAALTPEIIGIGAAVIGVTALFVEWAIQAAKVEKAVRGAAEAAVMAGRSGPGTREIVQQQGGQIAGAGQLSQAEGAELAGAISQINSLTDEQRAKVSSLAAAFAAMFDNNIDKTAKFIEKTFESETALKTYLDRNNLLGAEGQHAWDLTTDAAKRFEIGIAAIAARLGPAFEEYKKLNDQATIARANAQNAGGAEGGMPFMTPAAPQGQSRADTPATSTIDLQAAMMGVSQAVRDFATRIAQAESGGKQLGGSGSVRGPNEITTSSAGALGTMQVMPDSAFGDHTGSTTHRTVSGQSYDLTDPIQNVKAGLAILADLFRQFGGDQYKVAVGYNAGPGVASGQVQQSAKGQAETAGYTRKLGVSPGGGGLASPFRPNMGEMEPGTTADPAGEHAQKITDENDFTVKIAQIDDKLAGQQAALRTAQEQASAASRMAESADKDAAVQAADAKVAAVQRSIAALQEERRQVRSPADAGVARQAQDQIQSAKLVTAKTTNDPKEAAVENAEAEVNAYKLASEAANISDAAKEQFDRQYNQANIALINARKAAEGTWMEQQRSNLDAIEEKAALAGGTRQQIELRVTEAIKQYWTGVLQSDVLTTDQRRQAQDQLSKATIRLTEQQATAAKEAADKAFRTTEAGYAAQLAAAHGNLAQIIAIENDKLAFVRQEKGAESAEFLTALTQQTNAVRAAIDAQIRTEKEAGQRRIANETETLRAQAAAHQITKLQELQLLEAFVTNEKALELKAFDDATATLTKGTAAFAQAMTDRAKLAAGLDAQIRKLQTEQVQAATAAADQTAKVYTQAFASVGSSGNRAIEGLVMGQMTWLKAAQTVTQGMLSSFLTLTETLLSRWLAYEAAKISGDSAAQAIIDTTQATSGASGWPQLLAHWLGLEAAKTQASATGAEARTTIATAEAGQNVATQAPVVAAAVTGETTMTGATVAGTAARTGITAAAAAKDEVGFIVRAIRWLTGETTMTAATAAGETTRLATKESAAIAGSVIQRTTNMETVTQAAYTAAANTYASVAQIPYVGWILAPIAAAAAFIAVEAFGSFDTGSEYVPRDQMAQIHRGEIIIPAAESAKLRSTGQLPAMNAFNSARASVVNGMASGLNVQPLASSSLRAPEMQLPQAFARGAAGAGVTSTTNNSGSNDTHLHYNPTVGTGAGPDIRQQLAAHAAELKSWVSSIGRNGNLQPPRYS